MHNTTSWVQPSLPTEVEFAVGGRQDKKQNEVSPDWHGKQVGKNCSLICRLRVKNEEINMLIVLFFKIQPLTSVCLRCVQLLVLIKSLFCDTSR